MIAAFLALLVAAPVISGAPADPPTHGGTDGRIAPSRDAFYLAYEVRAAALREEMHTLQKSDGGQLSAEHLSYLQQKLEILLRDYEQNLQRLDPLR